MFNDFIMIEQEARAWEYYKKRRESNTVRLQHQEIESSGDDKSSSQSIDKDYPFNSMLYNLKK